MKLNWSKLSALLLGFAVVATSLPSFGQPVIGQPAGRRAQRRGAGDGALKQRRQQLLRQLGEKRFELAQILQAANPDRGAIQAKLAEIVDLERQRQETLVDAFFQAKQTMPPQQFENYKRKLIQSLMGAGKRGDRTDED